MLLGLELVVGAVGLLVLLKLIWWLLFGWWKRRPKRQQSPVSPQDPNRFDGLSLPGRSWGVADLVDFEYLLRSDRKLAADAARERDQAIFRTLQERLPECTDDRGYLLRCWLEARRHLGAGYLGGKDLVRAWKLVVTAAVGFSFAVGLVHAGGVLLLLDQGRHVSAPKAVLGTIGIQITVSAVVLLLWLVRKCIATFFGEFSSLRVAVLRAVLPFFSGKRSRFASYLEGVAEAEHSNGLVVVSHIVMAAQICVAVMSIGLLVSLNLYHYYSEDLRFGWSTTHRVDSETVHRVVAVTSKPWSYITKAGQPTVAQIDASRLTRDAPDYTVPADASGAWATFLSFCIVTYGVALRVLFALLAGFRARSAIKRPSFQGQLIEQLLVRMGAVGNQELRPADPRQSKGGTRRKWWGPWKNRNTAARDAAVIDARS